MEKMFSALRDGKACVVFRSCYKPNYSVLVLFRYNANFLKPNTESLFSFCLPSDTYTH